VLVRLAADSGFRAETLEKVIRLGQLANEIGRHPYLGPRLLLKGGSAIQLGGAMPQRLSVDLDYNYVGQLERAAMLAERPELERVVRRLARSTGYQVTASADAHAGRKFHLGYLSHAGEPDRIELDINYQMRLPLGAPVERTLWQPIAAEPVLVLTVSDQELWAGKIAALLDRTMPRDLFDVAHLRERVPGLAESAQFRRVVVAWCGMLPQALHVYGRERLDRVDDRAIEQRLAPMLASFLRISRRDLVLRAWEVLEPILALSPDEIEYCDRLQLGELRPDLVFGDDENLTAAFRAHPALQWKALNAGRGRRA
jgi:predicted nucleotidyltransferase component of viral defense system